MASDPVSKNQKLTAILKKAGGFPVLLGITGLRQIKAIDMSAPKSLVRLCAKIIAKMSIKSYLIH